MGRNEMDGMDGMDGNGRDGRERGERMLDKGWEKGYSEGMIDTHVHLEFPEYEGELGAVLERARAAGVKGMICVGGEVPRNRMIVELVRQHEGLYGALGIHPHWATAHTRDCLLYTSPSPRDS